MFQYLKTLALAFFAFLILFICTIPFLRRRSPRKTIAIVVLGDLGHSPRMQVSFSIFSVPVSLLFFYISIMHYHLLI